MATAIGIVEADPMVIKPSLFKDHHLFIILQAGDNESFAEEEAISEEAVRHILLQPREEMSIVRLLHDPVIRDILLRKEEVEEDIAVPVKVSREDSITEEPEEMTISVDESVLMEIVRA